METPQDNRTERARDAGFSLVELLVVLVILGILAAVVVFAVRAIVERRRSVGVRIGTAGRRPGGRVVVREEPGDHGAAPRASAPIATSRRSSRPA